MSDVTIYSEGLCYMSVCSCLDADATELHVRSLHPSGTDRGWRIADEPFRDGSPNPSPCHDDPARRHYLFSC